MSTHPLREQIEFKLIEQFTPSYLALENESHMHGGNNPESHFKLTIISDDFINLRLIERHKKINRCLVEELKLIHALSIHAFTAEEWHQRNKKTPESPQCMGGSKTNS